MEKREMRVLGSIFDRMSFMDRLPISGVAAK